MKILTRRFGELMIDEKKILVIPDGLMGFEEYEKFVLIEDTKTAPLCWLQSIEEPNLSLIVMNPFLFKPDYKLNLDELIDSRGWEGVEAADLILYVVVHLSKEQSEITIISNLLGPIIINPKNNEMVQSVIPNTAFSLDHAVLAA